MKSEAADYLGKARQCLNDAEQIAAATVNKQRAEHGETKKD